MLGIFLGRKHVENPGKILGKPWRIWLGRSEENMENPESGDDQTCRRKGLHLVDMPWVALVVKHGRKILALKRTSIHDNGGRFLVMNSDQSLIWFWDLDG